MKLIYWFKRTLRKLVRRLFHNQIPDWLTDIYGALAYVNFINLIPTLWAIMTVPEHFFRRADLLVEKRKVGKKESLYKSPVQLITTIATLTWTTKLLGGYVPIGMQKIFFGSLLVLMPLLIPIICILLIPLGRVSFWLVTHGFGALLFLSWWPRTWKTLAVMHYEQGLQYLKVPLSRSTYAHLDWRKLFWSALYFYGYLLSVPLFMSIFFGRLARSAIEEATLASAQGHVPTTSVEWALAFVGCIITTIYARLVIYPYAVAMLQANKKPTLLSRQIEMKHLLIATEMLYARAVSLLSPLQKRKISEETRRAVLFRAREPLIEHFLQFRKVWAGFPLRHRRWKRRFAISDHEHDQDIEQLLASLEGLQIIYDHLVVGEPSEKHLDFIVRWILVK